MLNKLDYLVQAFQIAPLTVRYVGDVTVPHDLSAPVGRLVQPKLDNERVDFGLGSVHAYHYEIRKS
jgi:hypothetical protein